jgi:hypothetical protein
VAAGFGVEGDEFHKHKAETKRRRDEVLA